MKIHCSILSVFLAAGMVLAAHGQSGSHTRAANKLYRAEKYDLALTEYQHALEENAKDSIAGFNRGDAYFRSSRFKQAAGAFDEVIAGDDGKGLRQKAFYNKGVSLSKQDRLEESIEAYKQAVILDPADEDARVNLQKALLEYRKKNPPPQQKPEHKEQQEQHRNQPPQSNLTQKQIEQLLKALQQREQQVQQKMQMNMHRSAGKQEKDW